MARPKKVSSSNSVLRDRPALTPEARENQLIALAMDEAERQMREGTASSQIITHFIKQGTVKAQLELERLRHENALLEAKTEAIQSAQRIEELCSNAIKAMQRYGGHGSVNDRDDYGDDDYDDY